jgi:hypothetical protein
MKSYQKTHKTAKALESHIAKIIARKGKFSVNGMTIKYSFSNSDSKPRGERVPSDTVEMIKAGLVTYRGYGIDGKYAGFYRIKVHKKEYRVTLEKKRALEELAGRKIPFKAPLRRSY